MINLFLNKALMTSARPPHTISRSLSEIRRAGFLGAGRGHHPWLTKMSGPAYFLSSVYPRAGKRQKAFCPFVSASQK
jgi:hypothetical protein